MKNVKKQFMKVLINQNRCNDYPNKNDKKLSSLLGYMKVLEKIIIGFYCLFRVLSPRNIKM